MSSEETPPPAVNTVESEGGEQPPSSSSGAKKSSTRARAEARRRRILEQGRNRLDVVSGEIQVNIPSDNDKQENTADKVEAVNEAEGKEGETPDVDASQKQESAPEEVATPSKTSSSQRLAQMRRRRFKKSAAAAKTKSTTETTTEETAVEETKELETKKESTSAPESKEESKTDGKKYLGVVKMRRKMLAEKKASEEVTNPTKSAKPAKLAPGTTNDAFVEKKYVSMLPIIFNLFTVLFLFLAGFDVGVQNSITSQSGPQIHRNLAVNDYGIGVLSVVGMAKKPSQTVEIIVEEQSYFNGEVENEFEAFDDNEMKPIGATDSDKEAKIDPLFGVDLDELTSGPGIIFALARMAVSVHKMFLYIFFSVMAFIKGIFTTMFAIPMRLMTFPPIMFLSAIIIRYVGKHALGGKLPEFDEILNKDTGETISKKDEVGTDVIAMGTNYAKNFFKSTFPRLVLVYSLFKDAKSDMFVILSGLFLGLVFPMNMIGTIAGRDGSEEL